MGHQAPSISRRDLTRLRFESNYQMRYDVRCQSSDVEASANSNRARRTVGKEIRRFFLLCSQERR